MQMGAAKTLEACGKFARARKVGLQNQSRSAAAHPLGVGDALYRHASRAIEVDTVPFGSFRRTLIEKIGGFDETLHTNEDYEFNARVRKSGGRVWLDPSIRSIYFARSTFADLARQYWRYGFWKWFMLRRYPNTLRWRQALPPLFVVSLLGLSLLSFFFPLAGWVLAGELLLYFTVLIVAGFQAALRQRKPYLLFSLPMAISVMHFVMGQWIFVEYAHFSQQFCAVACQRAPRNPVPGRFADRSGVGHWFLLHLG